MEEYNLKSKNLLEGFITAVHRERYEVYVNHKCMYAKLKASVYFYNNNQDFPTVGDNVFIEMNEMGDSLICKTKQRVTKFSRKDPDKGQGEQVVAANFDYIFIMMSLNYDFNLKRLERYITTAWQSGGTPVIILTKADIAEDIENKITIVQAIAQGIDVYPISSATGEGVAALHKYLAHDNTVVFLGSSGVGKSTLTNYLLDNRVMKTGSIRETDSKGHHTTTHRQMFVLNNGARIIDTPGMRELGMWDVKDGVGQSFLDITSIISNCRYHNCSHTMEDGCAVKQALEEGIISEKRWISYQKLQKESAYLVGKEKKNQRKGTKKGKTNRTQSKRIILKGGEY